MTMVFLRDGEGGTCHCWRSCCSRTPCARYLGWWTKSLASMVRGHIWEVQCLYSCTQSTSMFLLFCVSWWDAQIVPPVAHHMIRMVWLQRKVVQVSSDFIPLPDITRSLHTVEGVNINMHLYTVNHGGLPEIIDRGLWLCPMNFRQTYDNWRLMTSD